MRRKTIKKTIRMFNRLWRKIIIIRLNKKKKILK